MILLYIYIRPDSAAKSLPLALWNLYNPIENPNGRADEDEEEEEVVRLTYLAAPLVCREKEGQASRQRAVQRRVEQKGKRESARESTKETLKAAGRVPAWSSR